MNIRRIIKEEISNTEEDWGWANDVNPYEDVEGVKGLLSSGDKLQILNRCHCTLGGETEEMVSVTFLEYLKHVHNNTFITIILGNDMGILDMVIEGGVKILHFNNPKEWEEHFGGMGGVELLNQSEVDSSIFSEFKKRIPEMVNAYSDSI